eukprot:GHVN01032802.1.p1 GENE.GHVN01032802.1~~GHVN01032802.1.p1  ORF type:complete len:330 (+),score=25.81 GHVN01032802.1:88-1077(+)
MSAERHQGRDSRSTSNNRGRHGDQLGDSRKADSSQYHHQSEYRRGQSNERSQDHEDENNSGTTLYVTNIAADSRTDRLRDLFGEYGQIDECRVIKNPVTKESRGFAFISYSNSKDADAAKRGLDGTEIDGRQMRIEKAKRSRPHEPTPGQYMGPTGASVKYDQRGRLKPGYMPFYALQPPVRGGPPIPDERAYRHGRRSPPSGRYDPRGGRDTDPCDRRGSDSGRYDPRGDRYRGMDPYDRHDRRGPVSDRARYMPDDVYMPDPYHDRYDHRDSYAPRGQPMMGGGGGWGYDERRGNGRMGGGGGHPHADYREPKPRSRSPRERYPPRR